MHGTIYAETDLLYRNDITTNGTLFINKVNEGGSVTFTIHTQGIADNTNIVWSLSGDGVIASDFEDADGNALTSLIGESTVMNNMATATVRINSDQRTEGLETFTFNVGNNSSNVTINSNTGTETYTLTAVNTSDADITTTGIDEGQQAIVKLRTTNVADETVVNYAVTGIDTNDLDGGSAPLTGSLTIFNNGTGITSTHIGRSGSTHFTRAFAYAFYEGTITDADIPSSGSIRINNEGPWLPYRSVSFDRSADQGLGDVRFTLGETGTGFGRNFLGSPSTNTGITETGQYFELTSRQASLIGRAGGTGAINAWRGNNIYVTTSEFGGDINAKVTALNNTINGIWIYSNDQYQINGYSTTNVRQPYFARVISASRSIENTGIVIRVDRETPVDATGNPIYFGDLNSRENYVVEALDNNTDLRFNLRADASETANENFSLTLSDQAGSTLGTIAFPVNNVSPQPVYTMTASGVEGGTGDDAGNALSDSGNGFVVTEGGSVTYSLRSATRVPEFLGDRVSYTVDSEINDTDLAPNSNKLHSSFYLDNGGLGDTDITWTRVGILDRVSGPAVYLNFAAGETAATIRALTTRYGGSDSDPNNVSYEGLIRINGGIVLPFDRLDTTRTSSTQPEDFLFRISDRSSDQAGRWGGLPFRQFNSFDSNAVVEIAQYPTNRFYTIGSVADNRTYTNGVTVRGWSGNELSVTSRSRSWPFTRGRDGGDNNRRATMSLANIIAANPHVWVFPEASRPSTTNYPDATNPSLVNYDNSPIAVTLSFNRIVNLGRDNDIVIFNTNIPYPFDDDRSAAFTGGDNLILQRIGSSPSNITFNINADSTFEGYEDINLALPNNTTVSIPNIRVRDEGAIFNFTGLNANNSPTNRQNVLEGNNITFGVEVMDADDVAVDALSYRLVDSRGNLITDSRLTNTGNITLTGTTMKTASISIPTINTFAIDNALDINIEVQWTVNSVATNY